LTYVVKDLLEGIVRQRCHGVWVVPVPHPDGMVDALQHAPKTVHVHIGRLRLEREREKGS
jgi:hypothetical protein